MLAAQNNNGFFGRRIEANGSWSVYHVFTGAPVDLRQLASAGLSRAEATRLMQSLNVANCTCRPAKRLASSLALNKPSASSGACP